MGIIRKTASVGTLGLVSFRSKNEKLARAEAAIADIEAEREAEHTARLGAEARADLAVAELRSSRRKRRKAEARTLLQKSTEAVEEIGHAVAGAAKDAEPTIKHQGKQLKKQAKALRKDAAKQATALRKDAGKKAAELQKQGRKRGRKAAEQAAEQARHATEVAREQADQLRERVSS